MSELIFKPDDPEIAPNQSWVAKSEGRMLRRIRILALHPDGGYLFQELNGSMARLSLIGHIPEFNLRYIYRYEFADYQMSQT